MFDNLKGYLSDCNPKKKNTIKGSINPSSPKNDQNQFSPNHINTTSGTKVTRINKVITNEKVL